MGCGGGLANIIWVTCRRKEGWILYIHIPPSVPNPSKGIFYMPTHLIEFHLEQREVVLKKSQLLTLMKLYLVVPHLGCSNLLKEKRKGHFIIWLAFYVARATSATTSSLSVSKLSICPWGNSQGGLFNAGPLLLIKFFFFVNNLYVLFACKARVIFSFYRLEKI